jgi:hypothetical protein
MSAAGMDVRFKRESVVASRGVPSARLAIIVEPVR